MSEGERPAGLIPPDVRARLRDLQLSARRALGQQGIGLHPSRSRGAGLEFAQYRAYEPGDELRQVDWKLYARSDRFFVREAERESPLAVWIVVDASASMAQTDEARPALSRLAAARIIAACVAELALRQHDRFGLATLQGDVVRLVPPAASVRQRDRLLLELHALQARGHWPVDERLHPLWERTRPGDLVIMLGDFLEEAALDVAVRLASARRDVVAIRLLTVGERDFPFDGGHRFHDPESGEDLLGDGAAMREGFLERFREMLRLQDARFDAAGIRHVDHVLDEPLDRPLRRLFAARGAQAS